MGKRKRRVHRPPIAPLSPPGAIPCSSGMKPLSSEKPSNHVSTRIEQSRSFAEDIMGCHEQQNAQISVSHHHHHQNHNPGHSIHMKRSRNRGHHYPRHSQASHYSTYHGKNNSSFDNQVPFKVGSRWNSESGYNTEGRERAFHKPERIRSSNTTMELIVPLGDDQMICGTCERLLRQKHPLGSSSILATEPSVVAVLVCGHVFHADCLEQRTQAEDASDPPCPLCSELLSKTEAEAA